MAKVLIVDHDVPCGAGVAALVRSMGHEATVVHDAKGAVEFLLGRAGAGVYLVVLDGAMPGMLGIELLGVLRVLGADRMLPRVRVILFSAHEDARAAATALETATFVLKGDVDGLSRELQRHLRCDGKGDDDGAAASKDCSSRLVSLSPGGYHRGRPQILPHGGSMSDKMQPVRLAGSILERSCHACAFFRSREEEDLVLLPFVQEGYGRGEKSFHVVDASHRQARLERLQGAGIDVAKAGATGQIEIRGWEQAYLRGGCFDKNKMLQLIEEALRGGQSGGFGMTRLWANMEWALQDCPGVEDLVEYETRLNHILPKYNDVVVCTYDLNQFGATVVMDIMRTHPFVIIGGILQENPFYVPPDQFLEELRGRTTSRRDT